MSLFGSFFRSHFPIGGCVCDPVSRSRSLIHSLAFCLFNCPILLFIILSFSPVLFLSDLFLSLYSVPDGFHVESIRGMLYNPLSRAWSWTESTSINYALHAVKLEEEPDPDEDDPDDPTVIVAQAKARRWYN